MTVGSAPRLIYPVVVGWDWPDFTGVLEAVNLENLLGPMALEAYNPEGEPGSGEDTSSHGEELSDPPSEAYGGHLDCQL